MSGGTSGEVGSDPAVGEASPAWLVGADPVDGVSPDRTPSLAVNISGMVVVVVDTLVDVIVPSANRVVLMIRLVVPVPEMVESVLSGEEVESESGVTVSEIDTSESVLRPGIVGLLVLV